MKRNLVGVFGCAGVVVAALALRGAAQETSGAIPVCVGADRVLRAVENEQPCPAGSRRFVLASPSVESELKNKESVKSAPDPAGRQSGPVGNTVTAPFVVVDRTGRPILRVQESLPSEAKSDARVVIAGGNTNNFSMRFFNSGGVMIAGVGESQSHAGVFAAYDVAGTSTISLNGAVRAISVIGQGNSRLMMIAPADALPEFQVINNNLPIASLTQGSSGGGMLQLTDAGGTPTVQGYTSPAGVGVVRVGPAAAPSGLPGLPGSFIVGKKR